MNTMQELEMEARRSAILASGHIIKRRLVGVRMKSGKR